MAKLTTEQLQNWVTTYNNSMKLPNTKIPCSNDDCNTETTMFGTNLHERRIKFGNIETLLTTFQCKTCRQKSKIQALMAKYSK